MLETSPHLKINKVELVEPFTSCDCLAMYLAKDGRIPGNVEDFFCNKTHHTYTRVSLPLSLR